MYKLEISFLKALKEQDKEAAINALDAIFETLINKKDFGPRGLKNQLLTLNGMLYRSFRNELQDLEEIYEVRQEVIKVIEKAQSFEEIREAGFVMLNNYLELFNSKTMNSNNIAVNRALHYMNNNIHENITLGDVANEVHISKSYLSSLLAKHTKSTFPEIMNGLRIDNAKYLLRYTNISILDISFKCGFNSQSYFCSTFKKQTGYTPSEYRVMILED